MPPGKYGMQEEGDQEIMMDFLLPTGIFLKFPVSPNDTIKSIKKVRPLTSPFNSLSVASFGDQKKTSIEYVLPPTHNV